MKIIKDLPQHLPDGTANPDWLAIRAGLFTGSDFHQYLGIIEKELSDTAESNLYKKVLESLGETFDGPKTEAMERGTELEETARSAYWAETGEDVEEVAFVDYERLRAGCSPDGVIYDGKITITSSGEFCDRNPDVETTQAIKKIIEIKCPELKNYLKMAKGKIPPLYQTQMQYNMLITGAKSCDFVVYHPNMRLIVQEIDADAVYQQKILTALEKLNTRYDEILEEIKEFSL